MFQTTRVLDYWIIIPVVCLSKVFWTTNEQAKTQKLYGHLLRHFARSISFCVTRAVSMRIESGIGCFNLSKSSRISRSPPLWLTSNSCSPWNLVALVRGSANAWTRWSWRLCIAQTTRSIWYSWTAFVWSNPHGHTWKSTTQNGTGTAVRSRIFFFQARVIIDQVILIAVYGTWYICKKYLFSNHSTS